MRKIFVASLLIVSCLLLVINLYGLTQDIRKPDLLSETDLRFKDDISFTYSQAMHAMERKEGESDFEYTTRMTKVVSQSLAHIHWKEKDNKEYNVLVPIWENYFLYFMGKFSGIPEFSKYHFIDYQRSVERGIGICGDASMVFSQLLDKQGIENRLLVYPGHVITEVIFDEQHAQLFDPDFGVVIPVDSETMRENSSVVLPAYQSEGYSISEARHLSRGYSKSYDEYNNVKHFMTKKYYFEYISYVLKWLLPIIMLTIGIFLARKKVS